MNDCIFCKISASEVPCYKVFENNGALAFLDIHPLSPGHTVVVPKLHFETEQDATPEALQSIILAVQESAKKIKQKLNCAGFNIGWNHGRVAGQAVSHFHIHIIPRNEGDGGGSMHSIVHASGMSVEEVAKRLCQ